MLKSIQVSQTHKFHFKHILSFLEYGLKQNYIIFILVFFWFYIWSINIFFFFPQRDTFPTRLWMVQIGSWYSNVHQKTGCTAAWFMSFVFCRQLSAPQPMGEFHPTEKYETHQTPSQNRTGGVNHIFIRKSLQDSLKKFFPSLETMRGSALGSSDKCQSGWAARGSCPAPGPDTEKQNRTVHTQKVCGSFFPPRKSL